MIRCLGAVLVVTLAGCTSTTENRPPPAGSQPPTDYRAVVVSKVREAFFDPYSIRDASISKPFYATQVFDGSNIIGHQGWMVCVRANAKNRFGAYTGQSYTAMLFRDGVIALSIDGTLELEILRRCAKQPMEPFPEIEEGAGAS